MTEHRSLVSVIVPAYRHADYVGDCLRALAEQSYRPMELLIVDDASPDGTAAAISAVLDEVSQSFTRVVFRAHDENRGLVASLNEMLAEARGEFLFQNDSDDVAYPEAIETLVSAMAADPALALVAGDNAIIDGAGDQIWWDRYRHTHDAPGDGRFATFAQYLRATQPAGTMDGAGFGRLHTLLRENHVPNGKLMRTSAVRTVGGWREGTVEDWDLNFRLALRYRLGFVDEVLMSYRWHAENTIKNPGYAVSRSARTRTLLRRQLLNPVTLVRVASRLPLATSAGVLRRMVERSVTRPGRR